MTGWNLPPGCADADIDRAMGGDEREPPDEHELCVECGETCTDAACPVCSEPLCAHHAADCGHIASHGEQPEPADEAS